MAGNLLGCKKPVINDALSDGDEIRLGNTTLAVNLLYAQPEPEEDILTKAEKSDNIQFVEEFEKPNQKRWEIIGKDWEYKDGFLHQTKKKR